MRLFFGLSLPDAVRRETARMAERAQCTMPGRYAMVQNHHITLAFLGEIQMPRVPQAAKALSRIVAAHPAPPLSLLGADFFGRAENAVLILRVQDAGALSRLHDALVTALRAADLPHDPGPFSPHITLARHTQVTPQALHALCPAPMAFAPEAAHVFLSARDDTGVLRYTPIHSAGFEIRS